LLTGPCEREHRAPRARSNTWTSSPPLVASQWPSWLNASDGLSRAGLGTGDQATGDRVPDVDAPETSLAAISFPSPATTTRP
jgi:hypothetical protein